MLLGFLRKGDDAGKSVPVFIPSHLTCYVGRDAYDAILGKDVEGLEPNHRDEPLSEIIPSPEIDIIAEIRKSLSTPQSICCLRLEEQNEALVGEIAKAFPDESIYVLSPALPPLEGRPVSSLDRFGKSNVECFADVVGDVTGYRPRRRKTIAKQNYSSHINERPIHPTYEPIPVPKSTQKPAEFENEDTSLNTDFDQVQNLRHYPLKQAFLFHAKRDLPNLAFASVFVLLTFATSLGYFFLATNSNTFFEVTCLIMAILFPILSAVPIGFLYVDNGKNAKPMSLTLAFVFSFHISLTLICAFILLALGFGFEWDQGKSIAYFVFNLSPILWAIVRLLADPLIQKLKK